MSRGNTTIIAAVIAACVGGLIGFFLGGGGSAVPGGRVAELEAQIESARRFFPSIPELRTVSGTVRTVSGKTITIDADPSPNPFEVWPTTRMITVGESTRIVTQMQKDPAVYQKEFEAYQKELQRVQKTGIPAMAPGDFPTPPLPFEEKELKADEIDVGSRITAEAAENIKEAARFEATRITVQQSIAAGPGALPVPAAAAPATGAPIAVPMPGGGTVSSPPAPAPAAAP